MKNIRAWFHSQTHQVRTDSILLGVFFIFFVLGQLGRISAIPFATLYPHDFLIVLWLVLHTSQIIRLIGQSFRWLLHHPLVLTTTIWVGLGLIWGAWQHPELRPLLVLGRLTLYVLFAASVGESFSDHRTLLRSVLVLAGNIMLWFGLLQYIFLPDTRFLSILGWDDHYFRMIGSLFDPNFMGMMIVLIIIFTASINWLVPKKIQFLLQCYYAAMLALTYSRASYATAGMAAFLLLSTPYPLKKWRMRERLALGIAAIVVFSVVLVIAPKPGGEGVKLLRTSSITAREATASQTITQLTTVDLVLGRGLFSNPLALSASTSTVPQHAQVPDNILLLLLSGTGIFGTILVLASIIYWIGLLAGKETALAIALGVTLLHAQFNNTLFEPFICLYLLLALLAPVNQTQMLVASTSHFRPKKVKTIRDPNKR